MRSLFRILTIVVSLVVTSTLAVAHHGSAGYDMANITIKKATVTKFEWNNPHCQLYLDITDDKGTVGHWIIEAPPPPILIDRGWTRKSLQSGDVVTAYFHASKNGATVGILQKVYFSDGRGLWAYPDPAQSAGSK